MTSPVRLGAVGYLNARPLVHGLWEEEASGLGPQASEGGPRVSGLGPRDISVRFDVPAVCAQLLADNEIDLGLVPAVTYLDRSTDFVVPGIAIASDGPVASVALFTKKPISDVRVIALDTSSRTSVVLTRILCAKRFGIDAEFINRPPDLPSMLAEADAALIIGDLALFAQHESVGAEKIDLGQEWTAWTSLPFVWAFWAGRADAADRRVVGRLQDARDAGILASDAIADAYCAGDPARQRVAREYLRENIKYGLSDREQAGLARYFQEAVALGLARPIDRVRYF